MVRVFINKYFTNKMNMLVLLIIVIYFYCVYIFLVILVPLSDPTWFAPVINYVKSIAEHMKNDPNNYLVLLIITDGGIEGMN